MRWQGGPAPHIVTLSLEGRRLGPCSLVRTGGQTTHPQPQRVNKRLVNSGSGTVLPSLLGCPVSETVTAVSGPGLEGWDAETLAYTLDLKMCKG